MFERDIRKLCSAMHNWPKRCVILGAEGEQWPLIEGVGHNVLRRQGNCCSLARNLCLMVCSSCTA
eukprot:4011179-Alexandrium_andersonii.AAC.1